ncbi:MAG: response regulator transcription factor [Dorea sp.]|jgi:DNA-binding response OmpR family regulator|nr:response regulator transcription factor [Dorea sp.]
MGYDFLKQKKILLVDDEEGLRKMVCSILEKEGYGQVKAVGTAGEALGLSASWQPEFAILDVMLPDGDGFSLLEEMRSFLDIPVLFLTAKGEEDDRIRGFGLGADDYVVKPFLPRELLFRIQAILRRTYKEENPLLELAFCKVDFERAEVVRCGEEISLTAKEYAILQALGRNAGRIVTIDSLCEAAWGDNPYGYENTLMAHIRRIREKIEENPSKPASLITVKGLGYKLIAKR